MDERLKAQVRNLAEKATRPSLSFMGVDVPMNGRPTAYEEKPGEFIWRAIQDGIERDLTQEQAMSKKPKPKPSKPGGKC